MKRHWWMAGLTVLVMLLGLPMGVMQAQAPVPGGDLEVGDAQAVIAGGSLTYSFTYQVLVHLSGLSGTGWGTGKWQFRLHHHDLGHGCCRYGYTDCDVQ